MTMYRPHSYRLMLLMMVVALVGSVSCAFAQRPALSDADRSRLEACRRAILSGQLADGAIPVVCYRQPGQPAFVEPYFANIACLGLLSAHAFRPDPADLPFVARWLEWYAAHQKPDGTISRFNGTRGQNGGLNVQAEEISPDSHDSYAATYLAVAEAYIRATREKPKPRIVEACSKCLDVLARCHDPNGLYWNFDPANTPVGSDGKEVIRAQYLLDNAEVHQGLVAASEFFTTSDKSLAEKAHTDASKLAGRMSEFWYPAEGYFVCLFGDKAASIPWGRQPLSAEGLATVSALAFFDNVTVETRKNLWTKLMDRHRKELEAEFATTAYNSEDPTVERVYLAALRAAPDAEQAILLKQCRKRADELILQNLRLANPQDAGEKYPYVHRFGMMIQALLAQQSPLPAELPCVPLDIIKYP